MKKSETTQRKTKGRPVVLTDRELRAIAGIKEKTGDSEKKIVRDAVEFFSKRCNYTKASSSRPSSLGNECNYTRPRYVCQAEIMRIFGVTFKPFKKALKEGKIPFHNIGGVNRFDPEEVAAATLVMGN